MRGYGANYNGASADLNVIADHDVAKNFRSGTDNDSVAESRMALSMLFARAAQSYTLIEEHVVADLRSLADDNAHSVIDEESPSDLRAGVYFDAGEQSRELAYDARQRVPASGVQSMGGTMQQRRVEAGIA